MPQLSVFAKNVHFSAVATINMSCRMICGGDQLPHAVQEARRRRACFQSYNYGSLQLDAIVEFERLFK